MWPFVYKYSLLETRDYYYFLNLISNAFHTVVLKINLLETVKHNRYVGKSLSKLQIHFATYVFELSAGNCHR